MIETEGLPFAYIMDMMKQISDITQVYGHNFREQVEKALNMESEIYS